MSLQNTNKKAGPEDTCLNSDEHDSEIKDHLLHYLGCLRFGDRADFFDKNSDIWKKEVKHQEETFGYGPEDAQTITEQRLASWKENCDNELKRIDFLRKLLSQDSKDKHLVEKQEESLQAWRVFGRYNKPGGSQNQATTSRPAGNTKNEDYDLEKDITVPIIQFDNGKADDVDSRDVRYKFPNQKTTLKKLLHGEDNLLHHSKCSSDRIVTYFHVPSNNMNWVEQAIGRYFDEEPPDYHGIRRELGQKKKTQTYMILRDRFWRGQLHGSQTYSPAHTRHMTPLCTTISSDLENKKCLDRNMVLFMPYLHWDTSVKSEAFATEIDEIMAEAKQEEWNRKAKENPNRESVEEEESASPNAFSLRRPKYSAVKVLSISKLVDLMRENKMLRRGKGQVDELGRIKTNNRLGQFLLDAARLYEGISNYRDKMLLRRYLSTDPPLHPRRTLDQAYHWSLNSTWERDQDQVVYRHTTAKPEEFHRYDPDTKTWEGDKESSHRRCKECTRNIQKLSRVVMVDQLWMWILDSKTIITCFPKRYGSNKNDFSAVHKSIRDRLQDPNANRVRTACDLGLIIFDECVNALFNQAGVKSGQPQVQPQVIDAFSKAIGTVMHKQTVAFGRLWRWAEDAREVYKSNRHKNSSELSMRVLDINPEGKLEREIKDIVEELDIMIHITKVQKKMLEEFISNAEILLNPFGHFGGDKRRKLIGNDLWEESESLYEHLRNYREPEKKGKLGDEESSSKDSNKSFKERRNEYRWFKLNADELLQTVMGRIDQLQELRAIADHTTGSIQDLLGLKQQQAGVVQAWQAVRQSEETIKQSESIMIFTLVTIIFLPMSFMTSVFGMNNMEITSETWSIQRELLYMFTISAGVILLSLLLAFGDWARAGLYYLWKVLVVTLLVRTDLYNHWLDAGWTSKRIYKDADAYTALWKRKTKESHLERKIEKRNKEEVTGNSTSIHHGNSEDGNALGQLGSPSGHTNNHANGHSSNPPNNRGRHLWTRPFRNRCPGGGQSEV
ncbi:hypothetical protein F4811DRAFT_574429 [Daldinia bambusicola]|nr:hypothetical protein F4811DRAFT_574429 [Daldinia bambusicola]